MVGLIRSFITFAVLRGIFWISGIDLFERTPENAVAYTTSLAVALVVFGIIQLVMFERQSLSQHTSDF